ncbi:hypothetical protein [Jeongeupia sp. USM3]|uniref:hypothetical protein n=1 Tax=Jeongeupia sp. USM3 TaxID=1906741 RepID=UPI0011AB67E3|nr:hypothetical protein [Jeongeupia sp. USM3]
MKPEAEVRKIIDQKLEKFGWIAHGMELLNFSVRVMVREYITNTDPAAYLLFVNGNTVEAIAAKKDNATEPPSFTGSKTEHCANAVPK